MIAVVFLVMFGMVTAGGVRADIVSWTDTAGVVHYTNVPEEVPAAERGTAAVVVVERARPPVEAAGGPVAVDVEQRDRGGPPESATDPLRAYIEGLQQGLAVGQGARAQPAPVQINGPLVVSDAPAPVVVYDPYWASYQPLVSTGFDRGRSRHQTLRMLLQDQFAIDREGPYAYIGRAGPPLGPRLQPFLPRGLPPYLLPRDAVLVTR